MHLDTSVEVAIRHDELRHAARRHRPVRARRLGRHTPHAPHTKAARP